MSLDADHHPGGVVRVTQRDQLRGLRAHHQRLPTAQKHRQRPVVGGDGAHLEVLTEVADRGVALVEQIVGRLAQATRIDDALVQRRDLLGQAVDRGDRHLQLLGHASLQRVQLLCRGIETRGQITGAGQHDLARRLVLRLGRHIGEGVEELGGRIAQPGLAHAEHLFELHELVAACAVASRLRARQRGLVGQEFIVGAGDGGDVHAPAEKAGAGVLPVGGCQLDFLPRIAHRVRVGDVVAGGLQLGERCAQGPRTQRRQCSSSHGVAVLCGGCVVRSSSPAAGAAWC